MTDHQKSKIYINHWGIPPSAVAWFSTPLLEKIPHWLRIRYRLFWLGRAAFFETQTEVAKTGIARKLKVHKEGVTVISKVARILRGLIPELAFRFTMTPFVNFGRP